MDNKIFKADSFDYSGDDSMKYNTSDDSYNFENHDIRIEEVNIDNLSEEEVLSSIKSNFSNNQKLTNMFNKALYEGLREELSKLSVMENNRAR